MDFEGSAEGDFFKEQNLFRANAYQLIVEMEDMSNLTDGDTSFLVDEILHSIFFMGKITYLSFSPEDIFHGDEKFLDYMREMYPRPFDLYSSQIPNRSPFSCVLDMVVRLSGPQEKASSQNNLQEIQNKLRELISKLKQRDNSKMLFSTTLCVSSVSGSSKYYGVSMSTHRKPARQIMVAAGCLSYWDDCVAAAVMSYCPQKRRKSYFDGTFQLPADVRCEAFSIEGQRMMVPCRSCNNLFNLETTETKTNPYGNCAETESLSNLLKKEERVKQQVQRCVSERVNDRERAERDVLKQLKQILKPYSGFTWDNSYYRPLDV
ncbi:uncharacterized protein [Nothobranchius furzeri]|uniref:uncharacterized protein isoform X1 n=1 Tax=Nothobranchius furzeri TaxID=105023 RepID=UPI00077D0B62